MVPSRRLVRAQKGDYAMETISGLPFYPLEIAKNGRVAHEAQKSAILEMARAADSERITDLFVMSHGWNNDMNDARSLYGELIGNLAGLLVGQRATARKLAIVGIYWPSKKFTDEELIPARNARAGGGVSSSGNDLSSEALSEKLDSLKGVFDGSDDNAFERAKTLVSKLEDSPQARRQFVDLVRSMLPQPKDELDDASRRFFDRDGDYLLMDLRAAVLPRQRPDAGTGGTASLGANVAELGTTLQDAYIGARAAAWRLLNYSTYYQMKERAGVVGTGLNHVLSDLRAARQDLRIHLVGHSFGARVVTAATAGPNPIAPSSMTLLQGAFSHNAFTEKFDGTNSGFFRNVVAEKKVAGPIVITHTFRDQAVGYAYPLASRISGDKSAAFGDADDVFGGLGRNGAVKMKEGEFVKQTLLASDGRYAFSADKVHNLLADKWISSHGDVANRAVANAVLAAAGL
jgi:hypothetical protein